MFTVEIYRLSCKGNEKTLYKETIAEDKNLANKILSAKKFLFRQVLRARDVLCWRIFDDAKNCIARDTF